MQITKEMLMTVAELFVVAENVLKVAEVEQVDFLKTPQYYKGFQAGILKVSQIIGVQDTQSGKEPKPFEVSDATLKEVTDSFEEALRMGIGAELFMDDDDQDKKDFLEGIIKGHEFMLQVFEG